MTDMQREEEKPELLYVDLHTGRRFRPLIYPVTETLVEAYMDTVGDRDPLYQSDAPMPLAPPGLAAIYARLSYLQDWTMPPGGILTKQEFEFTGRIGIGDTLTVTAEVAESYTDDRNRKRVTFHIEAVNQDNLHISEVRLSALWPK